MVMNAGWFIIAIPTLQERTGEMPSFFVKKSSEDDEEQAASSSAWANGQGPDGILVLQMGTDRTPPVGFSMLFLVIQIYWRLPSGQLT